MKKRSPEDPNRGYADLDSVERDQWQSFINGLVPRGIAGLFFFDGEMVAQMAEEGESAAIRSSFNSLLGLDIVEQLQADLRTNLVRNLTGDDRHIRESCPGWPPRRPRPSPRPPACARAACAARRSWAGSAPG